MEIGKEEPAIVVEPLEVPATTPAEPAPEREKVPVPARREEEKVPA